MTLSFSKRLNYQIADFTLFEWQSWGLDWIEKEKDPGLRRTLVVPEYQREFVWPESQYEDFIASIFDRVQPSSIILDNRDYRTPKIIDGKHRIKAIIRFLNDDLVVRGTKYSELPHGDRMEFRMTIMPVLLVKHMVEKDIVNLYIKFNFERVPHTAQDREKADRYLENLTLFKIRDDKIQEKKKKEKKKKVDEKPKKYFCTLCSKNHRFSSEIGESHEIYMRKDYP